MEPPSWVRAVMPMHRAILGHSAYRKCASRPLTLQTIRSCDLRPTSSIRNNRSVPRVKNWHFTAPTIAVIYNCSNLIWEVPFFWVLVSMNLRWILFRANEVDGHVSIGNPIKLGFYHKIKVILDFRSFIDMRGLLGRIQATFVLLNSK